MPHTSNWRVCGLKNRPIVGSPLQPDSSPSLMRRSMSYKDESTHMTPDASNADTMYGDIDVIGQYPVTVKRVTTADRSVVFATSISGPSEALLLSPM